VSGYLLDTCAALWYFEGSAELRPSLRETLTNPASEVFFSDVSLLEIVIKHQIGKLPMRKKPSLLIPHLVEAHGLDTLPIRARDILRLESLPMHHRDPFDRLLVAQAIDNKLTIVSPDPLLRAYGADILWR
jgi:PIN domain nuclease of toxin-antitoxin system